MTEETPATPGWVDRRLDEVFAALPSSPALAAAREAYAACLAQQKAPSAPSDTLGAEFAPCRPALRAALQAAGLTADTTEPLLAKLEAFEAEIAADS